jgi:hypothetical protein
MTFPLGYVKMDQIMATLSERRLPATVGYYPRATGLSDEHQEGQTRDAPGLTHEGL